MGSWGSVLPWLLPAWPLSPHRLMIAIHALLPDVQSSGTLTNASKV